MLSLKEINSDSKIIANSGLTPIYLNEDSTEKNKLILPHKIELIPDLTKERQIYYICGESGSGKSTYASNLVDKYHKLKKKDTYLFSCKDKDPVFDVHKYIIRIPIDQSLLDDPINIAEECKNSLLIFDDVLMIQNQKLYKVIIGLISTVLQLGRSYKIDCIVTSHLINPNDKLFTRTILNEFDFIIWFNSVSFKGLTYYLSNYIGYDKAKIDRIIKETEKTRMTVFHRKVPRYIIQNNIIEVL
jgi:ABC-type dipeptide/oligopeptide/nickel transport system ATPase component